MIAARAYAVIVVVATPALGNTSMPPRPALRRVAIRLEGFLCVAFARLIQGVLEFCVRHIVVIFVTLACLSCCDILPVLEGVDGLADKGSCVSLEEVDELLVEHLVQLVVVSIVLEKCQHVVSEHIWVSIT